MQFLFELKNGKIKKGDVVIVVKDHAATVADNDLAAMALAHANGKPAPAARIKTKGGK